MAKNLVMITTGGYFPAMGRNTLRKLSDKYETLLAGDTVSMIYCESVDDKGAPVNILAKEDLVVTSVARGPFNLIAAHHLERNHAVRNANQEAEVFDRLSDLYDVQDGDAEEFLAIYFA